MSSAVSAVQRRIRGGGRGGGGSGGGGGGGGSGGGGGGSGGGGNSNEYMLNNYNNPYDYRREHYAAANNRRRTYPHSDHDRHDSLRMQRFDDYTSPIERDDSHHYDEVNIVDPQQEQPQIPPRTSSRILPPPLPSSPPPTLPRRRMVVIPEYIIDDDVDDKNQSQQRQKHSIWIIWIIATMFIIVCLWLSQQYIVYVTFRRERQWVGALDSLTTTANTALDTTFHQLFRHLTQRVDDAREPLTLSANTQLNGSSIKIDSTENTDDFELKPLSTNDNDITTAAAAATAEKH